MCLLWFQIVFFYYYTVYQYYPVKENRIRSDKNEQKIYKKKWKKTQEKPNDAKLQQFQIGSI